MTPSLAAARRVVVKIGSALVVDEKAAAPRAAWLSGIAEDIAGCEPAGPRSLSSLLVRSPLARRTLGLGQRRFEVGGKTGRGRSRADPSRAGMD